MKLLQSRLAARVALLTVGAVALLGAANAADTAKSEVDAKGAAVAVYTQEIIDAMDTDKNHEVSKQEFLAFMSKEFDRLDVNHDGKLQQTEVLNKPILGQQKSSVSHR